MCVCSFTIISIVSFSRNDAAKAYVIGSKMCFFEIERQTYRPKCDNFFAWLLTFLRKTLDRYLNFISSIPPTLPVYEVRK